MICLYCARWKLDWICSWLIRVAGLLVEGWKEEEESDKKNETAEDVGGC